MTVLATLAAGWLVAAPVTVPPPPPALAATLKDEMPDPDRIDWMRGLFPGASEADQATWRSVEAWQKACFEAGTARVRAELVALGQPPIEGGEGYADTPLCSAVASLRPFGPPKIGWDAYREANRRAGEAYAIFAYGARLGFEAAPFDPAWANEEARTLLRATVREQVWRHAFDWRRTGPPLPPEVADALDRRIGLATGMEDDRNTAMLKAHVAAHGWPTIGRVGARASDAAWLLVQHADQDPAFQLRALRLMEPLAARGEVTKANYAYLYDRVMLKLTGRQRYGTQFACDPKGDYGPRPLEPGVVIDTVRAEMGLGPLADYRRDLESMGPPCRPSGSGAAGAAASPT